MIGRKYIAIVKGVHQEDCIAVIEVTEKMYQGFFDTQQYLEDLSKEEEPNPGQVMNNSHNILDFIYFDVTTREVGRCGERDLLFDVTGLSDDEIKKYMETATSHTQKQIRANEEDRKIESELEQHFNQCLKLGYTEEEAVKNVQELFSEKFLQKIKERSNGTD